jgi:predicted molibdopterin-dependent oxidoreductase YjgC
MPAVMLRIDSHISRGPRVTFRLDGRTVAAHAGETVAAALLAAGLRRLRTSPAGGGRGMFCAMGVCQECVVERIDAEGATHVVASCRLEVSEGLELRSRTFVDGH